MHKVGSEADNEHRFKHMDEKHLLRVSLSCLQTVGKDHTHHSTYSVLFAVCLHFGGWFLCDGCHECCNVQLLCNVLVRKVKLKNKTHKL